MANDNPVVDLMAALEKSVADAKAARSNDIDRDHPDHCDSCGAPLDALGSCLGSCDPADEWDRYEDWDD